MTFRASIRSASVRSATTPRPFLFLGARSFLRSTITNAEDSGDDMAEGERRIAFRVELLRMTTTVILI